MLCTENALELKDGKVKFKLLEDQSVKRITAEKVNFGVSARAILCSRMGIRAQVGMHACI